MCFVLCDQRCKPSVLSEDEERYIPLLLALPCFQENPCTAPRPFRLLVAAGTSQGHRVYLQ